MPLQNFADLVPALIDARLTRGISQQKLADELGLTRSAVASWETRARIPGYGNAQRWAGFLGVTFPPYVTLWFTEREQAKAPRHGTRNGYVWHQKNRQLPACTPCKAAAAKYVADNRRNNSRSG